MNRHLKNLTLFILFFILFVSVKYLIASSNTGPYVFDDEVIYKMNAEQIFKREVITTTHYPPLYPFLLSLSFFSKDNWYYLMIFINVLISSAVVIPIWFISRRFLPIYLSLIVIILVCVSSFHLYYPRLIMSENLYVPMFLLSILLLLNTGGKSKKLNLLFNALFGISMALGYLTKYLHLPAIPCLIILWWIKPVFDENLSRRKIFEKRRFFDFLVVSSGFLLSYIPWLIYLNYSEFHTLQGMGLQFIRSGIPDYATMSSLILWISFYLSYFILAIAPYLLIFSIYIFMSLSGGIKNDHHETFFIITVVLLSVIFLMTAMQHSWRASYNYPVPRKIMGRYLMHLSPLYLLIGMISLNKIKNALHRLSLSQVIICSFFCFISFIVALEILFTSQAAEGLKFYFLNNSDAVMFKNKIFIFLFLLIFIFITGIFAVGRQAKLLSKHLVLLFFILLLFFQLSTSYKALEYVQDLRAHVYMFHGQALAQFLGREFKMGNEEITIVNDDPQLTVKWLPRTIKFWLCQPIGDTSLRFITIKDYFSDSIKYSDKIYFLTSVYHGLPLYNYVVNQKFYYVYDFKSLLQKDPHEAIRISG